jgi:RNA polymerase sigma-70 factor (ECF subfamily)
MSTNHPSADAERESTASDVVTPLKPSHGRRIIDVYLENQGILRSYISRFLVSSHEIDDVSQETFLRAYNAEKTTAIREPKAFLFRVAKNLMLSEFKKKSYKATDYLNEDDHSEVLDSGLRLEDDVIAQQKLGIYCEVLASLPPRRRKVMLMKKVYGMSHKEIAARMGVTVSAVEKHLRLGGRKCITLMAKRYPEMALQSQITTKKQAGSASTFDKHKGTL